MEYQHEQAIRHTWTVNTDAWTHIIRENGVESRRLATNQAIYDTVLAYHPKRMLDIGCGEGFLCREMNQHGIETLGVDFSESLIADAREKGGNFEVCSYEDIANGALQGIPKFDMVVCNFCLIGNESVTNLLKAIPNLLNETGVSIIQTLHPVMACGDAPYQDGWREGSWAGFPDSFVDPAPWYFRTIASWLALLRHSGLTLVEMREPLHPNTQKPASLILIAS